MRIFFLSFVYLCLFCNSFITYSQQNLIEGTIKTNAGQVVAHANISIRSLDSNQIIAYGVSNEQGNYKLVFTTALNEVVFKATKIGFTPSVSTLTVSKKMVHDVLLVEGNVTLKEIVVKSKKLKDTVKIKTDSLGLTERSTLRDILNKTDGITVSKEGGITYKGRQIRKVLINKKEVFVDQNKIALDNLDYGIMDNLQVINNYRDRFKMNFDNQMESVINVNTKKEFKGVVKVNTDVGYGYQDKYLLKNKTMFFSDIFNAFFTHNTNKLGIKDFSFEDISSAFKHRSTSFFKENFNSFFNEDELLKNSLDSNTGLTIRKEANKSKLGLVCYYNYFDFLKRNYNTTTNTQEIVYKNEELQLNRIGNSFLTNFVWATTIGKKTISQFKTDIAYSNTRRFNTNIIQNYFISTNQISENSSNKEVSFLLSNNWELSNQVNDKTIVTFTLSNDFENSKHSFNSLYTQQFTSVLGQQYNIKNNFTDFSFEYSKKLNDNNYFMTKTTTTFSQENIEITNLDTRKIVKPNLGVNYGYDNKDGFVISLSMTPTWYHFFNESSTKNKFVFNSSATIKYPI